MSPVEVATLYSPLHNGGFRTPPRAVAAVSDAGGATLTRYAIALQQVASAGAVAQVDAALRVVMERGTGQRSLFAHRGVAGKTGTSDDGRDAWFVGFDNDILVVVWVGYDDNRGSALSGSSAALQVFDALLAELGTTGYDVPPAEGLEEVAIDYTSGGRVLPGCGDPVRVLVPAGSVIADAPACARGILGGVIERARGVLQ
jgi:penicillin-binding protein 1B